MKSTDYNVDNVTKWLRITAMAVISTSGIFWSVRSWVYYAHAGLGPAGVLFHIATPGLILLAVAAIAWKWGVVGGIILIILGLFDFLLYLGSLEGVWAFIMALPSGLPPLVAGCLFVMSWRRAKRAKLLQTANNKKPRD